MVKGSTKTYGQLVDEARAKQHSEEIGAITEACMGRFKAIIEEAVQGNHDKGVTGKYYIYIWVQKDPYAQNALHIYPQCRRTRPSPYQGHDHWLWSVQDGGIVTFEWCIPSKEILSYILANPNKFDPSYVAMLRNYVKDKIEKLEDYLVEGKVI